MTPRRIIIEHAGEPVGKSRPRFRAVTTKDGRQFNQIYSPAKTAQFENALRARAQDVLGEGWVPFEGPLSLVFVAVFPVPTSWSAKARAAALAHRLRPTKKPDADNLLKAIDALNNVVWRDDSQVVDARVVKVYGERPCTRLVIEELLPPVPPPATSEALPLFAGAPA